MSQIQENLFKHLTGFATNPYLFVGSGLSRRYYGLPTWIQLLEEFYPDMKDPTPFYYYLSKSKNNPVELATELSERFHEIWWKNADFEESRAKYGKDVRTEVQLPFKYELANYVIKRSNISSVFSDEIGLLGKSIVDGIITTNWDDFLENTFKEFNVFIGQQELLFADSLSVGEIYKIHGSCSKPKSLVLTKSDYEDFNSRNAYLAAKLLTIFVEHPVIFLGYSLSDPNILEIVDSIVRCLDTKNINKLKDRLIFVEWVEGLEEPYFQDGNIVLEDKSILPIKHIKLNSFGPVYEVLGHMKRRLPLKLLRKIKDAVYEIVKTNKPSDNIFIGNLEDITRDGPIQFVVGIGVANTALSAQGYIGISTADIIEDVIFNNKALNPKLLVEHSFPKLAKGNGYIPLCKYLRELNIITKNGTLTTAGSTAINGKVNVRKNMPDCFMPPASYRNKKTSIRSKYKDIGSLIKGDPVHAIYYIPLLDRKNIDLKEFEHYLASNFELQKGNSNFRKLVCIYDYYKHCAES